VGSPGFCASRKWPSSDAPKPRHIINSGGLSRYYESSPRLATLNCTAPAAAHSKYFQWMQRLTPELGGGCTFVINRPATRQPHGNSFRCQAGTTPAVLRAVLLIISLQPL